MTDEGVAIEVEEADAVAVPTATRVRSLTIVETSEIAPEVRALTLAPEGDDLIAFKPGQWLSFHLPVGEHPPLVRAYSIANAARADGTLTICFDRVQGGLGSEYLWNVPVGTGVQFTGPVGNFVLPEDGTPLLMVSRFTGVVPFRAMLQCLEVGCSVARPVRLVQSAEIEADLIFRAELTELAARREWFEYYPIVAGQEIAFLEQYAMDWMPFNPMLCGVREFTFPTRAFFVEKLGFERKQVRVENYNGPAR